MLCAKDLIGTHDVLMVVLDALRYDVAEEALNRGLTPGFASFIPNGRWQLRHSPGNFTFPAHQAFFAGFLPTPPQPGLHERLFALSFEGSATTGNGTFVFDAPDIVTGFALHDYLTICIGGVGFFNKLNPLGRVLPSYFMESYWDESMGVTAPDSTANQVDLAVKIINGKPESRRLFMFMNVSALHQPNCIFSPGASEDSFETQLQALAYVDQHITRVIKELNNRAPLLVLIFSDHGTAYGEDGYTGHRISHPVVWNVPYAEFTLTRSSG